MAEDFEVGNLVAKVSMDDTAINKSFAELKRTMKVVQSEFEAAGAKLGDFGKSTDGLKVKAESLTKQIGVQQQIVAKLSAEHAKAAEEKGKDAKETQKLEARLNEAQAKLYGMQNALKETNAEITRQSSSWTKLSETLNSAGQKMQDVARTIQDAGRSLSTTVTAPLVAIGGTALKTAIDFESAFAGVRKTIDATEAEFATFKQEIRDMSKAIPVAATEITKVAEAAGQLGIKKEAIMGFSRTMVDLGVATNMTSDQAATALARLANITQMPQDQFDRLGATIVELGNNLATTESEIVEMGLRIAGAGNQIGLTEAQILAFAGSLSSVGIEAEAGGSAISRVMIDIASAVDTGGKKLNLFAQVAGMSASDFQKSFKQDAAGAILTFIEGLGEMSASGKNTFGVLEDLGLSEIRVRDALLRASGAGDLFRNSLELGTQAWEENTALTKEASERYKTTASQMTILWNKIKDVALTLGDALIPVFLKAIDLLQPFIDMIARMAEWFAALDSPMQTLIVAMAGIAAAIGPVLVIVGSLISSFGSIASALGTVSLAVAEAGGLFAVLTGPIGIAVGSIAGLTAVGVGLYNHFKEELIPTIDRFGEGVSESTKKAVGAFLDLNDSATMALNELSWSGQAVTGAMASKLTSTFSQMGQQITSQMQSDHEQQLQTMQNFFAQTTALTDQEKTAIVEKMKQGQDEQKAAVEEGQKRIAEILTLAKDEKRSITEAERQEINQIQQQMLQTGIQVMSENELEQKAILERMRANAADLSAQQAAEVVQNSVKQKDEAIKAANDQYNEVVKETIRQRDEIGSITADQADRILLHAQAQRDGAILNAKLMHQSIVSEAKEQAGEHIDAVDWETGEVLTRWDIFAKSMEGTWKTISDSATVAWESMYAYIKPAVDEIVRFIADTFEDLAEWWRQVWPDLKQAFENTWSAILTYIGPVMSGIKEAIVAVWPYVQNILIAAWETIKGVISGTLNIITGIIGAFAALFTGNWEMLWGNVKQILAGAWQAFNAIISGGVQIVLNIIGGMIASIAGYFTGIGKHMVQYGNDIVKGLGQGIMDMTGWVKEKVLAVVNSISDTIKSFFGIHSPSRLMAEYGGYLVEGLWQGIQNMTSWINGKVTEFASGIANNIKSFFGIASPSRLMAEYGAYIAEGLAVGMRNNQKAVADAAKAQADIVKAKTQEAKDAAIAHYQEMHSRVKAESELMAAAVTSALTKVRETTNLELAIAKQEFELFASTLGTTTTDAAMKLQSQMELLRQQLAVSSETVDLLKAAYDQMAASKGANSVEAQKLYLELLKEQTAYQGIRKELAELEKSYNSAAQAARQLVIEQGKIFENINGNWVEGGKVGGRVGANDPIYGDGGAWAGMPDWLKPTTPGGGGGSDKDSAPKRPPNTDREGNYQTDVNKDNFGGGANTNVRSAVKSAGEKIKDALDKVADKLRIPGLATGGTVVKGGWTMVGEKGPELLRLPGASQVIPNYELPRIGGAGIDYGALAHALAGVIKPSITQYNTFTSPKALTPSETARKNQQVMRQMGLEWG